MELTRTLPRQESQPVPERVVDLRELEEVPISLDEEPRDERTLPDALQGMYYSG